MKNIIQQVLAGNTDAFREIVREYGPEIRVFLAGSIADYQTVDDLAQETFIATYESLNRFEPDSNLRAWIYGIAKNKLLMHLRKTKWRNENVISMSSEIMEEVIPAVEEFCDEGNEFRVGRLRECIDKLPDNNRKLIKSRYFTDETVMDIAKRLQKTENTISVWLFRLRLTLKDCMKRAVRT